MITINQNITSESVVEYFLSNFASNFSPEWQYT